LLSHFCGFLIDQTCFLCVLLMEKLLRGWEFDEINRKPYKNIREKKERLGLYAKYLGRLEMTKRIFLVFFLCCFSLCCNQNKSYQLELQKDIVIGKDKGDINYIFSGISDITIDSNFNIYIADDRNYRVQIFNENGKYINTIGNKGMGPGEFSSYPRHIEVNSYNFLYVFAGRKIEVFNNKGNYIKTIKVNLRINDFKIDRNNRIIVLGYKDNKIFHVIDDNGDIIDSFGSTIDIPPVYKKYSASEIILKTPIRFQTNKNCIYYINPFKYELIQVKDSAQTIIFSKKNDFYHAPEAVKVRDHYSFIFCGNAIFKSMDYLIVDIYIKDYNSIIEFFSQKSSLLNKQIQGWLIDIDKKERLYVTSENIIPQIIRYKYKIRGRP